MEAHGPGRCSDMVRHATLVLPYATWETCTWLVCVPGGGSVDTSLQEKPVSVSHALQSLTSRENSLSVVALSVSQPVQHFREMEFKSNKVIDAFSFKTLETSIAQSLEMPRILFFFSFSCWRSWGSCETPGVWIALGMCAANSRLGWYVLKDRMIRLVYHSSWQ